MSEQPKWTPGPWVAFFEAKQCGATPRDNARGDVAHCAGHDSRRRTDEADANAHLIAAAPDLYAALAHMVHWHDQLSPADIAKAEAVLAKARGQS